MKKLSPLMLVGTGSDVGKSIITSAFCRIFLQDGYTPAPFKAQNMSNNSFVTDEHLEMSRSQAVQAEAAGVSPQVSMNPLLLKPSSDKVCDVIVNGKSLGRQDAYTYFKGEGRESLRQKVHEAFDQLENTFNPIVLEGAGSISEINLRDSDLVNMPMAIYAKAAVVLIADIERGGIFASLYGSMLLLTEEERQHVKGIIINKFRGDLRLFESGITMIEELCKVPVLGVIPYFEGITIEEEDSLQLAKKAQKASENSDKVNVVVVLIQHLSHFTDFDPLASDPRIHLYYSSQKEEIEKADIIIIPNSQSPINCLNAWREEGMALLLKHCADSGKTIIGLGSGYAFLGKNIVDVEGESHFGFGLLPITTQLNQEALTLQIVATFLPTNGALTGYLIEAGTTTFLEPNPLDNSALAPAKSLIYFEDRAEGVHLGTIFGTSMHGLFHHPAIIDFFLKKYTNNPLSRTKTTVQYNEYDKLADHIRRHVDMEKIYKMMEGNE